MTYMLQRYFGLLQREIEAYEQLRERIEREKRCLLTRSLQELQNTLQEQQKLVDEIQGLECERLEAYAGLSAVVAAGHTRGADLAPPVPQVLAPRDRRRWIALRERLKRHVAETRRLNHENLRIVSISREVFGNYLQELANLSALAGGYNAAGKFQGEPGGAMLDQRS